MYTWANLHSLPIRKSEVWPHQHQLQFSACVTRYINNTPHLRRHSCRQRGPAGQHALLHTLMCICVVKGAIHEQLAGVKSGKGRASVYDWVYLCLCVCVLMCVYMCPHVCHSAAVPDINVVTTKWVFDFYQRVQIALEEDHLVVGSWLSSL